MRLMKYRLHAIFGKEIKIVGLVRCQHNVRRSLRA